MFNNSNEVLYNSALAQGRRGQFIAILTGRSRRLLDLRAVDATCVVPTRHPTRVQNVPIDQVRGSEGRASDFDWDFNPLQEHTHDRWLNIAKAYKKGRDLPPVILIQIGDYYFVRDGHHRISVARALGQKAISAEVSVWQVNGRLPWQLSTPKNTFAKLFHPLSIKKVSQPLMHAWVQFREVSLACIQNLSNVLRLLYLKLDKGHHAWLNLQDLLVAFRVVPE